MPRPSSGSKCDVEECEAEAVVTLEAVSHHVDTIGLYCQAHWDMVDEYLSMFLEEFEVWQSV